MEPLSHDRWHQIDALLTEALDLGADAREALLVAAGRDDPALRRLVEHLLTVPVPAFLDADAVEYAVPLLPDLLAEADGSRGRRVGAYRLGTELGRGGMGCVYRAERADGAFEQTVALKLLHPGLDPGEAGRRFRAERQILASLDHPHIARLFDGGQTDDGQAYLVMEFVEGRPIDAYCDARRLCVRDRLRLFTVVGEAVAYAHRRLVVHRDLKPSNILVTPEGEVKLLDFEIARLLHDEGGTLTQTGQRWMTPAYAAPEQVRGEAVTTATDVYQLGALLYELLCGGRPFGPNGSGRRGSGRRGSGRRGSGRRGIERAVLEAEPEKPSAAVSRAPGRPDRGGLSRPDPAAVSRARAAEPARLRKALQGDLDTIVLKALAKEPDARYASAGALVRDVRRHLDGLPVEARRPTAGYRARRFVRRNRLAVAAAALVALSLVGGLGGALWQESLARKERAHAEAALAESKEVQAFLLDLIRGSGPGHARPITTTTGELLARGVARAEALRGQPLVQATVFEAAGQVHVNLGEFARAQRLFERALALRRSTLGTAHPAIAEALRHLATAHRGQTRYAEAEAFVREALAIQRAHFRGDTPETAETLELLGSLRTYRSDLDEAEALFREALAVRRATLGPDNPSVAQTLRFLAATLRRKGQNEAAAAHYREVLALRRRLLGPAHPDVGQAMLHLGDQYVLMGRDAEAEPLFTEGLRIERAAYGAVHPDLHQGIHSLAGLYERAGRQAEAEALWREGVALARALYGDANWQVGVELNILGVYLRRQKRYAEAEALHREALALYERIADVPQRVALGGQLDLGQVFQARGDHARAEALFRAVLARREQAEGPNAMRVAADAVFLADALVPQGGYAEAEALYLRALRLLQPPVADEHSEVQRILAGLVALYDAQGRRDEAARYRPRLRPAVGGG